MTINSLFLCDLIIEYRNTMSGDMRAEFKTYRTDQKIE